MAMYAAAGVGALCISSSVAAVMMNKKEDEVAVPAEQPEETVEKIEVDNSLSGTYTLSITHKGGLTNGAQNFSLIISGLGLTLNTNNLSTDAFKVWPNPAKETVNYQFTSASQQDYLVQLID